MEKDIFHSFEIGFSRTPVCVGNDEIDFDQSIQLLRGEYGGFNFPISMKYRSGKKWTDVLNPYDQFRIVSRRIIETLSQHGFTGWRSFELAITDKAFQPITGYYGLSITGRCGKPEYTKSERIEKRYVPEGPLVKVLKGLHLDMGPWDGCDFFLPKGTIGIEVTDRVRKVLEPLKMTNLIFKSHSEWEMAEASILKT